MCGELCAPAFINVTYIFPILALHTGQLQEETPSFPSYLLLFKFKAYFSYGKTHVKCTTFLSVEFSGFLLPHSHDCHCSMVLWETETLHGIRSPQKALTPSVMTVKSWGDQSRAHFLVKISFYAGHQRFPASGAACHPGTAWCTESAGAPEADPTKEAVLWLLGLLWG